MYVNAKIILVEIVSGIRRGRMNERSGGGNSSMVYLIHCKNLCKCYSVPQPSTTIKIKDNLTLKKKKQIKTKHLKKKKSMAINSLQREINSSRVLKSTYSLINQRGKK
jgi:hypothetical protein